MSGRDQGCAMDRLGFACATKLGKSQKRVLKRGRVRSSDAAVTTTDDVVKRRLQAWAKRVVVDLNLCPFAQPVVDSNRVKYTICHGKDPISVMQEVMTEALALKDVPDEDVATTIIGITDCLHNFEEFHQFAQTLEEIFEQDPRFNESIMPAWFHPRSQWEFTQLDEPVNYDKRAPVAVINLLRTESVDAVVESGATQGILERNSRTLADQGSDRLRELYEQLNAIE